MSYEVKDRPIAIRELARLKIAPQQVCKITPSIGMKCVRFGGMLAYYDAAAIKHIVADVNLLSTTQQITDRVQTLFKCPDGTWVESDKSGSGQFSATDVRYAMSVCLIRSLTQASDGRVSTAKTSGQLASASLPSGITGFDRFSGSCLSPKLQTSTDWAASTLSAAVSLHTACNNYNKDPSELDNKVKTIMDGDAAGTPNSPDVTTSKDANGDTVVTATSTDSNGTKTSVSTNASNGDTTVVTVDSSGNTTTTDVTSSGGGTAVVTTDPSGHTNATFTDSSSGTSHSFDLDSSGHVTDYTLTRSDGSWEHTHFRSDGTRDSTSRSDGTWAKWGPDGKTPTVFHTSDGTYIFYDDKGKPVMHGVLGDFADCSGDTVCGQCAKATELLRSTIEDCFRTGGSGSLCSSYQGVASCCGQSTKGDPRILMPSPEGEMICSADTGPSKDEMCRTKCSVADSPDCVTACLSSPSRELPFSAMDVYCQRAISEDSFTGPSIPIPVSGGQITPKPQPNTGPLSSPFAALSFK